VVEIIPSYYSIRLAAVASSKEILDLEKWLSNNLTTYKDAFFEVILPPPHPDFWFIKTPAVAVHI
jgi:CCR4-NOT transcription complex subunit 1